MNINGVPYRGQKIKIDKAKDKFKLSIWHYTKTKEDKKLQLTPCKGFYLTQEEAEDKAKELIDKNLITGIWMDK